MSERRLTVIPLPETYAICRLDPAAPVPVWATGSGVASITRTAEELSIVCPEAAVPPDVRSDRNWRGWRAAGTFDLTTMTGVLASLVVPLAEARISVFTISTYDTDYLWVKAENFEHAADVLRASGHTVVEPENKID